jgi:hypothetical protein
VLNPSYGLRERRGNRHRESRGPRPFSRSITNPSQARDEEFTDAESTFCTGRFNHWDVAFNFQKQETRIIMRFVLLAAAATLALTGTAMAAQQKHHQHHQHQAQPAAAPVADGAVPADTLSAHDLYIRNLHDSGYNPATDSAAN